MVREVTSSKLCGLVAEIHKELGDNMFLRLTSGGIKWWRKYSLFF